MLFRRIHFFDIMHHTTQQNPFPMPFHFGRSEYKVQDLKRVSNFWAGRHKLRVGKITDFCFKQGKGLGKRASQPRPIFQGVTLGGLTDS